MPFEDLEAGVNSAVVASLSNRTLVLNGAVQVRGIFERAAVGEFGLVQSSSVRLTVAAADAGSVARGDVLDDATDQYRVIGIEPDGTGLLVLSLQKQA